MAPRDALRQDRPRRVVVLGIGNAILSDEGVGVHAVRALAERYELPDGVEAIDGGTAGMELFDALADTDVVVVIDAVKAKREPGSLVCLAGREVPVFFRSKLSPHQVSICDVLASLEFAGSAPADLVLVGVEPGSFELGTELTSEVAGRVPDLLARVVDELAARGVRLSPRAGAGR